MTIALHKKWHWLPAGPPGRRFRNRYHQHQKSRSGRGVAAMVLRIILAAVAAVIGFILVFLPGPAFVFFLIAGALLASDWLPVARTLDWAELHGRRAAKRAQARWRKFSTSARLALVTGALLAAGGASYVAFQFIR